VPGCFWDCHQSAGWSGVESHHRRPGYRHQKARRRGCLTKSPYQIWRCCHHCHGDHLHPRCYRGPSFPTDGAEADRHRTCSRRNRPHLRRRRRCRRRRTTMAWCRRPCPWGSGLVGSHLAWASWAGCRAWESLAGE
jgi:hypothetical protein